MCVVHVCESIRVSVYKTPTGLQHLFCHVGDLCLSLSPLVTPVTLSLIVGDGRNSKLKYIVRAEGRKMEVRLILVLFFGWNVR